MWIKIPQLHDLPETLKKEFVDKTGCSLPEWEISVPREHNSAWSIVLSYLMATDYRKPEDFSTRLTALTGSNKNAKLVKRSIRNFNPYRNRWSCFYDEILKSVVNNFRKHLDWDKLSDDSDKLSFASEVLQCRILLIKDYTKLENYQNFKKTVERNKNLIVLIASTLEDFENPMLTINVSNFMIDNISGQRMKKAALQYYLKETDLSKKVIKRLPSVVVIEDTFIKAVLSSKYKNTILDVYKSPYVVSKLSEAGYEMDPKAKDSKGFSGLYYALKLKDTEILYKLYYFAVYNCNQAEVSFRNPDPNIVSNLQYIEALLLDNISNLKDSNHHQQYCDMEKKFEELLKLNTFLTELNKKIIEIKNKPYNFVDDNTLSDLSPTLICEASKSRDVVVCLLDTYKDFFNYQDNLSLSVLDDLDDYVIHKNYYLSVDIVTAKYFFYNIAFLKERLDLKNCKKPDNHEELKNDEKLKSNESLKSDEELKPDENPKNDKEPKNDKDPENNEEFKSIKELKSDKQFSEIESSFFFSVLYNVSFENVEHDKTVKDLTIYPLKTIYVFPLKYRSDNLKKLKSFSKILSDITINKTNVVKCIPESEAYSIFHSHTTIKDALGLIRLINYLEMIKKLRITDIKSVLVIERVLQVIGECLPPEDKDDFSFRRFLSLCLPKEIVRIFCRLRNELTHLKPFFFPAKLECEKNISLFRSILWELRRIEKYFKPINSIIYLSLFVYFRNKFTEEVKDLRNSYSYPFENTSFLNDAVMLSDNLLSRFFKQVTPNCHDFLKAILINLKDEIEDGYLSEKGNVDDMKNTVLYILWPLKWLLKLLQQCGMEKVANLLDSFKKLESCDIKILSTFKEKIYTFMKECYDFLPSFNVVNKTNESGAFKSVKYIEYFLEILKGRVYLSNEDKDQIRKEIPENIKQQVSMKDKLIQSMEQGSPSVLPAEFELSYLSKKNMKCFRELYESEDSYALTILKTQDPIAELEEIFIKDSVDKKQYDKLCETMKFSEKTRKKLGRIVAGQRQKPSVNNLVTLLNRIHLLKVITIYEDEEIRKLWFKIKSKKSRQLIDDKIVRRCMKDPQFQAAIEMLLLDCMNLFEIVKRGTALKKKSSKLYQGISMRNIISHGNPLVETLCSLLDPHELPSEIVKKILLLIKDEAVVKAILELYEHVNNDFTRLMEVINCDDNDEYCELRDRIRNCNEWKNYARFLPHTYINKNSP